jgi:hypothetical protein
MEKIVLKKDDSLDLQKKKLHQMSKRKTGLDAKKYSGIISVKEDPIQYQKRVRAEWDESTS